MGILLFFGKLRNLSESLTCEQIKVSRMRSDLKSKRMKLLSFENYDRLVDEKKKRKERRENKMKDWRETERDRKGGR